MSSNSKLKHIETLLYLLESLWSTICQIKSQSRPMNQMLGDSKIQTISLCNKKFCELFNLNQHVRVHYTLIKTLSDAPYVTRSFPNFSI